MELFLHQQNLLFFRKQLAERQSLSERLLLLRLLAEEEAKDQQRPRENNALVNMHVDIRDSHEQIN